MTTRRSGGVYREPSPPEPEPEDTFVLAYGQGVRALRARLLKRTLAGFVAVAVVAGLAGSVHVSRRARLATAWSEAAACLDPGIEEGAAAVRRRARDRQLAVAPPLERWSWPRSCWSTVAKLEDRARAADEPAVAHEASVLRAELESPNVHVEPFGDALVALAAAAREGRIARRPVAPYAGLPTPLAGVLHREALSFYEPHYPGGDDVHPAREQGGITLRGRYGWDHTVCVPDAEVAGVVCELRPRPYTWEPSPVAPCGRTDREASLSFLAPAVSFANGVTVALDGPIPNAEISCDDREGEDVAWIFDRRAERLRRCETSGCTTKPLLGLSPRSVLGTDAPLEDLVVTHGLQITVRAHALGALRVSRRPVDEETPDLERVVFDDRPTGYADPGKRYAALSLVRVLPMSSSHAVVVLGFVSTVAFLRLDLATLSVHAMTAHGKAAGG